MLTIILHARTHTHSHITNDVCKMKLMKITRPSLMYQKPHSVKKLRDYIL